MASLGSLLNSLMGPSLLHSTHQEKVSMIIVKHNPGYVPVPLETLQFLTVSLRVKAKAFNSDLAPALLNILTLSALPPVQPPHLHEVGLLHSLGTGQSSSYLVNILLKPLSL